MVSHNVVDAMYSYQCTKCVRDEEFRDNTGPGCEILLEAILINACPEEWDGNVCDAFEPAT